MGCLPLAARDLISCKLVFVEYAQDIISGIIPQKQSPWIPYPDSEYYKPGVDYLIMVFCSSFFCSETNACRHSGNMIKNSTLTSSPSKIF